MALILNLLNNQIVWNALYAALGVGVLWLIKRKISDDTRANTISSIIMQVVQEVYDTYVRSTKQANTDGKMTDTQRTEAQTLACVRAEALLKEKGIVLGSRNELVALIEDRVTKAKRK